MGCDITQMLKEDPWDQIEANKTFLDDTFDPLRKEPEWTIVGAYQPRWQGSGDDWLIYTKIDHSEDRFQHMST